MYAGNSQLEDMETNVHLLQQQKDKMPQNKCNKICYNGDLE